MADLRVASLDDPLALLMIPPNETSDQRADRLAAEQLAKRISDELDEQIKRDAGRKKKDNRVKLLLLGKFFARCKLLHVAHCALQVTRFAHITHVVDCFF